MPIIFPSEPHIGELKSTPIGDFIFDGVGWTAAPTNVETDPIYLKDKPLIAFKTDIPDVLSTIEPQLSVTFKKSECEYFYDFVKIPHTDYVNDKNIIARWLIVQTTQGTILAQPIIVYPPATHWDGSGIYQGFYLKDVNGLIGKNSDFDYFTLKYDITTGDKINYDTVLELGDNAINEEFLQYSGHSTANRLAYQSAYPERVNSIIETVKDPDNNYSNFNPFADMERYTEGSILQQYLPYYMGLKKANIIARPYVNAASYETIGSNSKILVIASHNYNGQSRIDITTGPREFFDHVIAETAGVGNSMTILTNANGKTHCSYGFGVEFFENYNMEWMKQVYPWNYTQYVAGVVSDSSGKILTSTLHPTFADMDLYRDIIIPGSKIYWNLEKTESSTIAEILSPNSIRLVKAVTPFSTVKYIASTGNIANFTGGTPQQSATCNLIMGKFRKIQDTTGAGWQLCREAARATAYLQDKEFTVSTSVQAGTITSIPLSNPSMFCAQNAKIMGIVKIGSEEFDFYGVSGNNLIVAPKATIGISANTQGIIKWDVYRGFGIIDVQASISYIEQLFSSKHRSSVVSTLPRINAMLTFNDLPDDAPISKKMIKELLNL